MAVRVDGAMVNFRQANQNARAAGNWGAVAVRKLVPQEKWHKRPTRQLSARVLSVLAFSTIVVECDGGNVEMSQSFEMQGRGSVFDDEPLDSDDDEPDEGKKPELHDAWAWSQLFGWEAGARRLQREDMVADMWVEGAWAIVEKELKTLAVEATEEQLSAIEAGQPPTAELAHVMRGFSKGITDESLRLR